MGILDNFLSSQWSNDPTQNDAINQGLLSFGAGLIGAHPQDIGKIAQHGIGTYGHAMDSATRRRLAQSQIDENASQAKMREAQMADLLLKQAQARAAQAARMRAYGGESLGDGINFKQASAAVNAGNPMSQPNVTGIGGLSLQGLEHLGAYGAADGTDVAVHKARYEDDKTPGGTWVTNKATGRREFMPDKSGLTFGPNGEQQLAPGAVQAQSTLETALARAKAVEQEREAARYKQVPTVGPNGQQGSMSALQMAQGQGAAPGADPMLPLSGGQPAQPGLGQAVQNAGRAAAPRGFNPTEMAPQTKIGMESANTDVGTGNTEWITKVHTPLKLQASSAQSMNNALSGLTQQLSTYPSGRMADIKGSVATWMEAIGIAPKQQMEFLNKHQSIKALLEDGVFQRLMTERGVATGPDAQRAMNAMAQTTNQQQANKLIINFLRAGQEGVVAKADFYNRMKLAADEMAKQTFERANYEAIDEAWKRKNYSIWDNPLLKDWAK